LRIALVSKTNGCIGGASYVAENLGAWLLEAGHEAVHFSAAPKSALRPFQRTLSGTGVGARMARHLNWRARRLGLVEPFAGNHWSVLKPMLDQFDVFHFHDLYQSISFRLLHAVSRQKPVFLTGHDCSVFTGGCLYPMDCRRFCDSCGGCPQRVELGRFDFTHRNLGAARGMASNPEISYVFPSRWIQGEAEASVRFGTPSAHIPNGFDPRPYLFGGRGEARQKLGLAGDQKIVVVASSSLENRFKGVAYALKAIVANRDLNPLVILIGHPSPAIEAALGDTPRLAAGFVEDRARMGMLFSAADVLLFPSLADNLPVTIQEAMAAGTPVLAFATGGIPEMVRDGDTGWLVPPGDQEALDRMLREVLTSADTVAMGARARRVVADEFSASLCVERHVGAYRAAIERREALRAA
jgi:glycosyltransferase involved in cell wall biosynthesis